MHIASARRRVVNNVTTLTSNRPRNARPDSPVQTTTRIYLVGILRAVGPHGENLLPRSRKAQAVLAYLCLAEGRQELRSRLAGLIWDRCPEQHAKDSLRKALNELERAGNWRFERDRATIRLDNASCWIDVFEGPVRPDLLLDG